MRKFIILLLSIITIIMSPLVYFYPVLANFIAAWTILGVVCGLFVIVIAGMVLALIRLSDGDEWKSQESVVKLVNEFREVTRKRSSVAIGAINKVFTLSALLYSGWVVTAVIGLIVWYLASVSLKKIAKLEI